MEAWKSGDRLWFVFRDLTSADTTYPSARFLYTDAPGPDGKVVMDFNRAQNPPCAYNPWTTCPLPPSANKLAVRIEAGEKRYHSEPTSNAAVLNTEVSRRRSIRVTSRFSRSRSFSSSRPVRRRPWSFATRLKAAAAPGT